MEGGVRVVAVPRFGGGHIKPGVFAASRPFNSTTSYGRRAASRRLTRECAAESTTIGNWEVQGGGGGLDAFRSCAAAETNPAPHDALVLAVAAAEARGHVVGAGGRRS